MADVRTQPSVKIVDPTTDANAAGVTTDGDLQVTIANQDLVSTNNSTTSTLGISANFTGTADDALGYSSISVTLDASHNSATDGMTFEFSTDNSNWDDAYLFTYTAADGARRFEFPVTSRYFRLNYTNGGTEQTHFRVQTILHRHNLLTTIERLVDDVDPDRAAQVIKSALFARAAGTGDFVPIDSTASGNLRVAVEEWGGVPLGNGTEAGALRVTLANNSTGIVDLGTNNDVIADGTVAHDGLDSGGGGPLKIGGRAQEPEAQPEEVADNDRVDALFDRNGYQRVRGDFDPSFADINDAVSGDNTIIAAQASGKRIAVWSVMVVSDGTVDVRFEDGAGGTAFTGQIPLQAREGFTYSAGGMVPLWVGSAATLLNLELSAAINVHGSVSFSVMDD